MPRIIKGDAWNIARKFEKDDPTKPGRQKFKVVQNDDGKHIAIKVFYAGKHIARFGIKHSPRRNAGHSWIPSQIFLSNSDAYRFSTCEMTIDDYIDILIQKGEIPNSHSEPS